MKNIPFFSALFIGATLFLACSGGQKAYNKPAATAKTTTAPAPAEDKVLLDTFADLQILRYELPGWDKLDLRQKTFIYYLSEATLAGRDIIYDQHCKYNLAVRKTLEGIFDTYKGDRASADWKAFEVYAKRVWFSNGIHHHYNESKIVPGFSKTYFTTLVQNSDPQKLPLLGGEDANALIAKLNPVLFDPAFMAKRTNKEKGIDVVKGSSVNFYEGVSAERRARCATTEDVDDGPCAAAHAVVVEVIDHDSVRLADHGIVDVDVFRCAERAAVRIGIRRIALTRKTVGVDVETRVGATAARAPERAAAVGRRCALIDARFSVLWEPQPRFATREI